MILAEKIVFLRKRKGWSQEELADKLDISRQSVSKWELGASIPDLDKIIKLSDLFDVTTDYLLKDDAQEIACDVSEVFEEVSEPSARKVSVEEANLFMDLTERLSGRIAFAVSLFILSPVPLLFLGGVAEYKHSRLTDDMAGGFGVTILLVLVAIGVAILILNGMQLSEYEYLEKEAIFIDYGLAEMVEEKRRAFEPKFRVVVTIGVFLCIIGVIPLLMASGFTEDEFVYVCCVDILLILICIGVHLFVRYGMVHESYEKLLQRGDYTEEKKALGRKTSYFPRIYWCLVTAIYLGSSCCLNNWRISWIVWPVAGVLFAALYGIVQAVAGKNRQ